MEFLGSSADDQPHFRVRLPRYLRDLRSLWFAAIFQKGNTSSGGPPVANFKDDDDVVSENGRVENAEIVRSSGYKILDREAEKAVREWHFAPAEQAGEPVASHVEVPVVFRLGESE